MTAGRNDLNRKTRQRMVVLLEERLLDLKDLGHRAEWNQGNVKEPSFIALRKLFDKVGDDSRTGIQGIVRRIAQLGGSGERSLESSDRREKKGGKTEDPSGLFSAQEQVADLSRRLSTFRQQIRLSIESADEANDGETADLFRGISRGFDRYLWLADAARPNR